MGPSFPIQNYVFQSHGIPADSDEIFGSGVVETSHWNHSMLHFQ
jgi:hypothetical protein